MNPLFDVADINNEASRSSNGDCGYLMCRRSKYIFEFMEEFDRSSIIALLGN